MNKLIPLYLYKLQQIDTNENCKNFEKLEKYIIDYSEAHLLAIDESVKRIKLNKERNKDD